MIWKDALEAAQKKLVEANADRRTIDALDNRRQFKKFLRGWGRVRELAGLPHGRACKV